MATFVTLYKFTEQGVRNIKDSPRRIDALRNEFKKAGAEIVHFYGLTGQFDTMIIAEAPNEETMVRLNIMIDSMGNVTSQTMRAFTEEEFRKIVSQAAQASESLLKAA